MDKEKLIKANENCISIKELRILYDLEKFNRLLLKEEFYSIILVYQKAIDRVTREAKEQGIDI